MISFSRRSLAIYAADQLQARVPAGRIAKLVAAALLLSKNRKDVELLIDDINQEIENRGLVAKTVVTSAHELSASLRQSLVIQIKKAAGVKEIILEEQISEDVVGGVHIETANHSWDKTIRRKLSDIKEGI